MTDPVLIQFEQFAASVGYRVVCNGNGVIVCQSCQSLQSTAMDSNGTSDFPLADASIASPSALLRELQQEKQRLRREKLSSEPTIRLTGRRTAAKRRTPSSNIVTISPHVE